MARKTFSRAKPTHSPRVHLSTPYDILRHYYCAKANNKPDPELTLAIVCDLSKAFDVINHKTLLSKI